MIVTNSEVAMWVMQPIGRWSPYMTAIGDIKNNKLIAGIAFESQNKNCLWGHMRADEPPSKEFWIKSAHFIFNQTGCKRFSSAVEADNEKAIKLNKHIGFVIEATLKDAGKNGDIHVMTLWRDNCRFLKWAKNEI